MAVSEVAIANSALAKLGDYRIVSLNDATPQAKLLKEQFDKVRDDLLRSHPWNFAIERVQLAALSSTPTFGFTYEFQLPTDCIRVLETSEDEDNWQKEGNKIRADYAPIYIKYIKKVEDPGLWDANFSEVFATKLAADVCFAITQNVALKSQLFAEYEQKLREARSFDGQEGSTRQVYARQWLNSRR